MNESFRLLEGLDLERMTAEEAVREIRRIVEKTRPDMAAGYYVERMAAIGELARVAAGGLGDNEGGSG